MVSGVEGTAKGYFLGQEIPKQASFGFQDPLCSQKTMGVCPWMNTTVGPSEARRAKEGTSADAAEERKDTTGVNP